MKKAYLFCIIAILMLSACVTSLNLKEVEDKAFALKEISFVLQGERFDSDIKMKDAVKGLKIESLVTRLNNELSKNGINVEVNVDNFKNDQKEGLKYLGKDKIGISEDKMFEIPKWTYPWEKEQYIHLFIMQKPESNLINVSFVFIRKEGEKKSDYGVKFDVTINEVF